MKKLALFILSALLLVLPAWAQQYTAPQAVLTAPTNNAVMTFSMSATGRGPCIPLIGTGVVWHHIVTTVLSGTVSGLTFTLDTSADCNTFTTGGAIASTSAAVPPATTNSLTGVQANYVSVNITALTGGGAVQFRYEGNASVLDPCFSPLVYKQDKIFNALAAATLSIANVAGMRTYVCDVMGANAGTGTTTMLFTSGTGAACGTNPINMTGIIAVGNSIPFDFGALGDTGISRDFCITPGGTAPSASGRILFVQQ